MPEKKSKSAKQTKPKTGRSKVKIERDRVQIEQLLGRGYTLRQIGQNLKLSKSQVHREVGKILAIIREELVLLASDRVNADIEKLGRIQAEAWSEWERSQEPLITHSTKTKSKPVTLKNPDGSTRVEYVEEKVTGYTEKRVLGNPKYLERVTEAVRLIHDLLGTFIKVKIAELEGGDDTSPDVIRFEQAVSIPGLGRISPELFKKLMSAAGKDTDLWHLLEGLLQNQEPHSFTPEEGANGPPSDD